MRYPWVLVLCVLAACGRTDAELQSVWDDMQAMHMLTLPTLDDFNHVGKWTPNIVCARGAAYVRNDIELSRTDWLTTVQAVQQTGVHDIELSACGHSALSFRGRVQRTLEIKRTRGRSGTTVDALEGNVQVSGPWQDMCEVMLRGIQQGGEMVYRGRLCDEQVEHRLPLP